MNRNACDRNVFVSICISYEPVLKTAGEVRAPYANPIFDGGIVQHPPKEKRQ